MSTYIQTTNLETLLKDKNYKPNFSYLALLIAFNNATNDEERIQLKLLIDRMAKDYKLKTITAEFVQLK